MWSKPKIHWNVNKIHVEEVVSRNFTNRELLLVSYEARPIHVAE